MPTQDVEKRGASAEKLRAFRKKLGINQTRLAALLKINRSYLSELENGLEPSGRLRERIEELEASSATASLAGEPSLSQRLQAWRTRLNLSPEQAARALRIAPPRYQEYEGGRAPTQFFSEKFGVLEHESETVIQELAAEPTREGETEPGAAGLGPAERQVLVDLGEDAVHLHWIPLISWAQAGRSLEADFCDVVNWEQRVATAVKDPHAIAVLIRGDSMEPKISDGDTVTLLCSVKAQNGDVVVARLKNGGVLCKLFHLKGREGRTFVLTSFNPAYPPTEHVEDDFFWIYPVHSVNKTLRR